MSPKKGKELTPVEPLKVKEAKPAADAEPGSAAAGSNADENKADPTKTSWIEIKLIDEEGNPVPGERYKVTMPDGKARSGTLDHLGFVRLEGIDSGTCKIAFPRLDGEAWGPA